MNAPPTPAAVRAALDCIPSDLPHDDRVRLAFAVFDGIGDGGRELWLEWAGRRSKPDPSGDAATWRSARKRGPVTVATLFGIANAHGHRSAARQPAAKPTAGELAARVAERRAADERAARETAERQRQAAADAAALWARGSDEGSSPYLERKKVGNHGGRFLPDGAYLVPLRDAAGGLVNVQRILSERPADGGPAKLFVKGGRKTAAFHLIGDPEAAPWLLATEGYATGASIHAATGLPVAVAFDAGNLAPVVRALRGRWPAVRLAVAGDDDRETADRTGKNPGRLKATEAAKLAQGPAIFPPSELLPPGGTDFNDLAAGAGLAAVRDTIEAALRAAETPEETPTPGPRPITPPAARQRPTRPDDSGEAAPDADTAAAGFRCDDAGVWRYIPPGRDGGEGGWRRVCPPLHAEALARDQADGAASLVLTFHSLFGQDRRLILPLASVAGEGGTWRGMLADAGFAMPADAHRRRWLGEYLAGCRPAQRARLTERTGWHCRAFVLPSQTLGGDDAEPMLFIGDKPEGGCSTKGDADRWRFLIGRHCVGQSRLAFSVSAALAGPLLAWVGGTDSGGIHWVGDSSSGKTVSLKVGASVWGGPSYLQRWRGTDNGIEAVAAAHSDLCLMLDELGQLDPKAAGEAAYTLGNGTGKIRAARTGGSRPRLTWRLLFLSAGELGLSDHMAEAGKKSRAGQELRLIDIAADAGRSCGIFDSRGGFDSAGELARHLEGACAKAHGSIGRAWLEHLTENTETLSRALRERMAAFEAAAVPEAASGQVQRVARRFALIAAGGEMATAAGLTGWPEGEAQRAARRVFDDWLESRPAGIGASEEDAILRQVRGWFEAHGEARFTSWARAEDDHRAQTMHRAGWRRVIETMAGLVEAEATERLVLPEVFRGEVCKGWSERAVLRLLDRRGDLHKEKPSGFTCRVAVPGFGRAQVIRIRSSLFLDEADG